MTLHLSACGTEEFLTAIAPEIGSATEADETDIDGINSAAKINGVDSGNVIEDVDPDGDNLLEVSGKLNITDNDTGEEAFITMTVNGDYGVFNIDAAGNWNYAADNQQSAIQNLTSNATLTENLTVSSVDGTTHTVKITIIGVIDSATNNNNAAVITGVDSGSVTEDIDSDGDGLLAASGKLNITDLDAGEAAFIVTTINGNYGNVYIDINGNWSYGAFNNRPAIQNLNSGATLIDKLTVSSVDGTTHNIVITIHGVDEPPSAAVITGTDTGSVTEDVDPDGDNLLETGGKLNITDNNPGEAEFIAGTVTGSYGSLTIDAAGNWNYAAGNNQSAIQNLTSNATLTENLTVSSVDGTTHTVKITIIGVIDSATNNNNAAVITGVDSGSVTEDIDSDGDGLLAASGKLNITDLDTGEAAFIVTTINGNYGNLNIDISGNWSYGAFNNQTAIQNLATGATLTDNLVVSSVDGTTHTVVMTINGVDEPPTPAVIAGTDTGSVTEDVDPDGDNLLETIGTLTITDINPGEAAFTVETVAGSYGSLTIDTAGNWNYAADNNQAAIQNLATGATLTDNLVVRSVDGTTHSVVITINGVDEPPTPAVIAGTDTGSVTEDVDPDGDNLLEAIGTLTITDINPGEAAFTSETVAGSYGSLTIDTAGNWNYAADNNQAAIQSLAATATLTDNLVVRSVDGTTHSVVITINGVDEPNTITLSWVAPAEREDNSALSLSAIAGYKVYYGTMQGQYSDNVAINDGTAVDYTFTGLPAGTYYFVVTTIDTEGRESQYSSEVTVN